MGLVHCRQKFYVDRLVMNRESVPPVAPLLNHPTLPVAPNQPRHLRSAQSGHLPHVAPYQAFAFPLLPAIFLLHQCLCHPAVNLLPVVCFTSKLLAGRQKLTNLFHSQPFSVLHSDHQLPACGLSLPSGSSCVRNTPSLQAHPALYKTLTCVSLRTMARWGMRQPPAVIR